MIRLENVNKSFGDLKVLNDISITFESGKTNLIIGQSGSGKTVLLKSIIGLHDVDNGAIYYNDRNFTELNHKGKKEIRKEMGMVFQGGALFDSLNVKENVKFPLDMFSTMSEKEKNKRVEFCLDRVNIQNANHLYPAEISGGMQKRVAIARAIALNPKYLFCDEPNSGLDPVTAIVIDNLIQEITKEFNMTTIINTHDMNSVMEIGEKILFISKGFKAWEGNKDQIFNTENQALNDFVFASDLFKNIKKST
ncbi:ABC transporter ATP-binding protein [Marinifilum sp. D737]|uniref:ABC transporter ATP-binding protein n=1 Tax=Marinifilum sp. D737 TaxID=2969628 RepID=UPI0022739965|nr:ATP-binding cassette domain-containing protein [Marinifilum sp. D737]MCY1634461.1 ATP-binding cassette domain-containing protein [Marinifilum sp. D737]